MRDDRGGGKRLDRAMTQTLPPAFLAAVKDLLGPKGWSEEPEKLLEAATPWRGTYQGETPLIVRPASTAEAAALVKLCGHYGVAMTW